MALHWHAFAYTGHGVPNDAAARDPIQPVPPRTNPEFFRKPASMRRGTHKSPDTAQS